MTKEDDLAKIEQHFHNLIIKYCPPHSSLANDPDFEFPKLTTEMLDTELTQLIAVPGYFGGFCYYLEGKGGNITLYAELSSRMDHSSDSYSYFEITPENSRTLRDAEREDIKRKFWEFTKKAHEEHMRKIKEKKEKYESS